MIVHGRRAVAAGAVDDLADAERAVQRAGQPRGRHQRHPLHHRAVGAARDDEGREGARGKLHAQRRDRGGRDALQRLRDLRLGQGRGDGRHARARRSPSSSGASSRPASRSRAKLPPRQRPEWHAQSRKENNHASSTIEASARRARVRASAARRVRRRSRSRRLPRRRRQHARPDQGDRAASSSAICTDARPFSVQRRGGRARRATRSTLCQRIADARQERAGVAAARRCEWVPVTVDNRLRAVQQGDVDLLCAPTSVTLARRQEVVVLHPDLRRAASARWCAPTHPQRCATALERTAPAVHARLARLAALQGAARSTSFAVGRRARRREHGSRARRTSCRSTLHVVPVPDYAPGCRQLLDRKVDVFFGERVARARRDGRQAARQNLRVLDRQFTYEPLALALAQRRRRLPPLVDRALSQHLRPPGFRDAVREVVRRARRATRARSSGGTRCREHEPRPARRQSDMIQRSIKRLSLRALVVDDELGTPDGRRPRDARARAGAAGPRHRGRRGDLGRGRHVGDRLGLRHPRRADRLDARRRQRITTRARALHQVRPLAQRQDPDLPDGRARRGVRRSRSKSWRWSTSSSGRSRTRRRSSAAASSAAIRRYLEVMLPPLAAALMKFSQEYEYSWHTPGHTGRHRVSQVAGRPDLLRLLRREPAALRPVDQRRRLGSLLDHTGPDRRAREVRGPGLRRAPHLLRHQRHVHVEPRDLHGRGGARPDRAVRPQLPQVDRAQPGDDGRHPARTWCRCATATASSARSRRSGCSKAALKAGHQGQSAGDQGHRHARRSTRSSPTPPTTASATTPGACEELLDPSVDRIHFDEAWYAYARFNPLYRDRHAMHGDPKDHKGPTVFATHSTHKLLAALSQASLLHIRDGRSPIPHSRFNESYMMQASTSPLYPIIVSNDITAAMMDGPGGPTLTNESIEEAVAFRQTMGRVHREFAEKRRLVLQDLERGHGQGAEERQEGRASRMRRPSCSPPIPTAGCCIRARRGTASATSKTATACSTRSRCRSSRRASPTRAASTSAASRRRW